MSGPTGTPFPYQRSVTDRTEYAWNPPGPSTRCTRENKRSWSFSENSMFQNRFEKTTSTEAGATFSKNRSAGARTAWSPDSRASETPTAETSMPRTR